MKDFLDFISSMQLGLITPYSDLLDNYSLMSFMIFYTLAFLITIIIETNTQENIENECMSTFIEGGIRTLVISLILSFALFIFVGFLVAIIDASLVFLLILTAIFGTLGFVYSAKYVICSIRSGM